MRLIVGLAGPAQAGKDTVANYLAANAEFTKLAVADPLKEIASLYLSGDRANLVLALGGLITKHSRRGHKPRITTHKIIGEMESFPTDLDDSDPPKPRVFLQKLGDRLKDENKYIFANCLRDRLREIPGHVVITDVRYPSEAGVIKRQNGLLIRLDRKPKLNGLAQSHDSEHAWKSIEFDFTIDSNGDVGALLLEADILLEKLRRDYMEH